MSEEYFAVLKQEVEGLKIGKLYNINEFYRDESGKAIMINIYNDNMDLMNAEVKYFEIVEKEES